MSRGLGHFPGILVKSYSQYPERDKSHGYSKELVLILIYVLYFIEEYFSSICTM